MNNRKRIPRAARPPFDRTRRGSLFLPRCPSGGVSPRRRDLELSVERPLGPDRGGTTVRLTVRFDPGEDGTGPSAAELARELEALTEELNALIGSPIAATPIERAERELTELVETYRPRQRELVDLLLDEGELTVGEHARLVEYLAAGAPAPPSKPSAPFPVPETERLIATVPIDRVPATGPGPGASPAAGGPRATGTPRTVAELLKTYEIATLRQAGAVRARRQISFAEYMALKRHFEQAAHRTGDDAAGR